MEAVETIFKLIIGICILLFFGYLMSFITGGISKFFGTTSTLNGRVVATPDTLDENIRELKELKSKFLSTLNKYKSKYHNPEKIDISEKIKLLKELDGIKEKNIINDSEYSELKRKILE